ncbi:hypothetical protein C1645_472223 [Glomus cerebriforme]|uniref:Crinkler effector protein N-terminal domain-containing protein n=1 Tax=Glomus cerebriforme TaxID=658196 RepID=A0A397TE23_9GLOM|nr:hypothetical protein C1645_472223 [Glomus cerebriforme]
MTNVSLTCRLSKDIQEKAEKFIIDVITTDTIDTLKEKVKESRNDIFFDIEADHLMLWKVQIPNGNVDEFMNLTLRDDESKNIQKLKGIISNFWEEQPSEEFTHVVIDSPYLIGKRKMQELTEQLTRISIQCRDHCTTYVIPDGTRDYLQNLYYAKIIRLNDELCIDKNYKKKIDNESFSKKVYIKCKVVDFNDGILSVTLVDYEKDQKKEILFMEDLELWLLDEFELDGKYRPKDYKNCAENIDIIRDGEWLGSIAECRRKYIKNQLGLCFISFEYFVF